MDPDRLLRLHRPRLRPGDADVLRPRAALGERDDSHQSSVSSRPIVVFRRAFDAVLTVVLAPRCAACDALLDAPSRGPVCAGCWASILPLTPPLCQRSADPLP